MSAFFIPILRQPVRLPGLPPAWRQAFILLALVLFALAAIFPTAEVRQTRAAMAEVKPLETPCEFFGEVTGGSSLSGWMRPPPFLLPHLCFTGTSEVRRSM